MRKIYPDKDYDNAEWIKQGKKEREHKDTKTIFYLREFPEEVQNGIRKLVRNGQAVFCDEWIDRVKNYMGYCGKPVFKDGNYLTLK